MKKRHLLFATMLLGVLAQAPANAAIVAVISAMNTVSSGAASMQRRLAESSSSSHTQHSSYGHENNDSTDDESSDSSNDKPSVESGVRKDQQAKEIEKGPHQTSSSDDIQRELVSRMLFAKRELAEKTRQTSYSPSIERTIGLYESSLDTVNCNRLLIFAFNEALVETRNEADRLDIVDYISDVIRKDGCLD